MKAHIVLIENHRKPYTKQFEGYDVTLHTENGDSITVFVLYLSEESIAQSAREYLESMRHTLLGHVIEI